MPVCEVHRATLTTAIVIKKVPALSRDIETAATELMKASLLMSILVAAGAFGMAASTTLAFSPTEALGRCSKGGSAQTSSSSLSAAN